MNHDLPASTPDTTRRPTPADPWRARAAPERRALVSRAAGVIVAAGIAAASIAAASIAASAQDAGRVKGRVVLNAVGDLSLPTKSFAPLVNAQGPKLFDSTRPTLAQGDLNFVNIETAISANPPSVRKKYAFSMHPDRLDWILDAGFNLISLANNHTNDAGEQGVKDTLEAMERRQRADRPLIWSGVSLEPAGRYAPVIFERKGTRFAFFSVGFENTSHAIEPGSPVHQALDPGYREAIRAVRGKVDVVIVSSHFGREYDHAPDGHAIKLYRGFVDAGADLILGHHPHVIRGVERYKEGLIFHSLGNFAFASRTSRHHETGAKMVSMIAQVVFEGGKIAEVKLIPLYVNNLESWSIGAQTVPKCDFAPVVLDGPFARSVIEDLQGWTRAIPGNAARIEIEGDVGVVRW